MSQENVEAFKRWIDAYNRQDVEAMVEEMDPEVEYHPVLPMLLGGEATVYRGHDGVRGFQKSTTLSTRSTSSTRMSGTLATEWLRSAASACVARKAGPRPSRPPPW